MNIYKELKYILLNCPPDNLYVQCHQQSHHHHFYWLCSIPPQGSNKLMSNFMVLSGFYLNLSSQTNSDSFSQV